MIQQLKKPPSPKPFEVLVQEATKGSPPSGQPDPDILLEMNSLCIAQHGTGILGVQERLKLQDECRMLREQGRKLLPWR